MHITIRRRIVYYLSRTSWKNIVNEAKSSKKKFLKSGASSSSIYMAAEFKLFFSYWWQYDLLLFSVPLFTWFMFHLWTPCRHLCRLKCGLACVIFLHTVSVVVVHIKINKYNIGTIKFLCANNSNDLKYTC